GEIPEVGAEARRPAALGGGSAAEKVRVASAPSSMLLESIQFALDSLRAHKLRAGLTGLGMVIGNASVIVVVTVALAGRGFVLKLIEGVGSNLVYAYYEPGGNATGEQRSDYITLDAADAV